MKAENFDLKHFLEKNSISPQDPICVGVSGGVDSMTLLSFLAECHPPKNITVLHVNHLLRGDESNLDEALVKKVSSLLWANFEGIRVDIENVANSEKISLETAGRQVRRAFFEASAKKWWAKYVFLAHHEWDQAETVLRNFIKGSRLRWLSGMLENDGFYVRPFLGISKWQIIQSARASAVVWREDASNTSSEFERNRLRNDVLPILKTINPEAEHSIAEFALFAQKTTEFFRDFFKETIISKTLDSKVFASYPDILKDSLIEQIFAGAHENSTVGLSAGNIAEIRRFILEARGGTKKQIGKLSLAKKLGRVMWN